MDHLLVNITEKQVAIVGILHKDGTVQYAVMYFGSSNMKYLEMYMTL